MATFKELFKLDLKDYQEKGAKYALLHHYCVIGDRMGLGKTPQGIAVSLKTGSKTLVVCPADLRLNWEHEFYKFAKKKPAVAVIESSKDLENLHLDLYRVVRFSFG